MHISSLLLGSSLDVEVANSGLPSGLVGKQFLRADVPLVGWFGTDISLKGQFGRDRVLYVCF